MPDSNAVLPPVHHDVDGARFLLQVDGLEAVLEYERRDGAMVITHTRVPDAIGGRGIAAALVRAALEHAGAQGLRVVPACSYAAVFMQRHGEYAGLLG